MISPIQPPVNLVSSHVSMVTLVATTSRVLSTVAPEADSNVLDVLSRTPTQTMSNQLRVDISETDLWTGDKKARFKELVHAEALSGLSVDEEIELEKLTKSRRNAVYPRTADEILWERRQQKVTSSLVRALEAYVQFHDFSNNS